MNNITVPAKAAKPSKLKYWCPMCLRKVVFPVDAHLRRVHPEAWVR